MLHCSVQRMVLQSTDCNPMVVVVVAAAVVAGFGCRLRDFHLVTSTCGLPVRRQVGRLE
jgi:hypothetical protein